MLGGFCWPSTGNCSSWWRLHVFVLLVLAALSRKFVMNHPVPIDSHCHITCHGWIPRLHQRSPFGRHSAKRLNSEGPAVCFARQTPCRNHGGAGEILGCADSEVSKPGTCLTSLSRSLISVGFPVELGDLRVEHSNWVRERERDSLVNDTPFKWTLDDLSPSR